MPCSGCSAWQDENHKNFLDSPGTVDAKTPSLMGFLLSYLTNLAYLLGEITFLIWKNDEKSHMEEMKDILKTSNFTKRLMHCFYHFQ